MTTPAADDRTPDANVPQENRLPARSPHTSDSRDRAVVEIERENAALRRLFDEVAEAIGPGGATDHAGQLMVRLYAELKAHFRMEEVDGVFDQIERDAPQMLGDLKRLRVDHMELLADAAHLVELGRGIEQQEGRRRFSLLFQRFREHVASHESQENGVVQRAYCVDEGTKD